MITVPRVVAFTRSTPKAVHDAVTIFMAWRNHLEYLGELVLLPPNHVPEMFFSTLAAHGGQDDDFEYCLTVGFCDRSDRSGWDFAVAELATIHAEVWTV